MTHRLIKNGELCLYGPVGFALFSDDGFTATDVLQALTEMDGAITVRLNSPGGSAFDGIAIYNALKARDEKITMIVDGVAASAASIIAMAGGEIIMPEGSLMMIHDASGLTIGTANDHRQMAGTLDKLDGEMARVYAKRTGMDAKAVLNLMDAETWMNGEEAVEKGFATQSGDAKAQEPAAWNYKEFYRHAPERLAAMADEWGRLGKLPRLPRNAAPSATSPEKENDMAVEKGTADKPAELKTVTLETLKAERPDLVTALAAETDAKVAAAAKAERDRILAIETSVPPGYDAIVAAAKADGKSTAADVALAVMKEQKAMGIRAAASLDTDEARLKGLTSEHGPANGLATEKAKAPGEGLEGEARWKAEYAADAKLKGEFITEASYIAYKKAESEGRVRILKGKAA